MESLLLSSGSWCMQSFVCTIQDWSFCFFPQSCGKSCTQIPLTFMVRFPGDFQSFCWVPRLGSLTWGSKPSQQFSSVAHSCPTLRPHGLQHTRPPCPSPAPGVYSNSCPLSRWCHPTISSSVVPFSSCLQSFPALGSFNMSQLFTSGGQSIGVSASTSVFIQTDLL